MTPLFIIGMERAGTTTLFNSLAANKCVDILIDKEPGCFNLYQADYQINEELGRKLKDYFDYFEKAKFNLRSGKFFLDATPLYLTDPLSLLMINKLLPNPKFIIVFRNPVDRAVSGIKWDLAKGRKDYNAILEENIKKSLISQGLQFLEKNYLKEDILLFNFSDLRDAEKVKSKLKEFLNIEVDTSDLMVSNQSGGRRKHLWLYRLNLFTVKYLSRYWLVRQFIRLIKLSVIKDWIVNLRDRIDLEEVYEPQIDDNSLERLAFDFKKLSESDLLSPSVLQACEESYKKIKK